MIDRTPIRLVPATDADVELWRLTKEVSERLRDIPWVLIGGQMVAVIEARESGDTCARTELFCASTTRRGAASPRQRTALWPCGS